MTFFEKLEKPPQYLFSITIVPARGKLKLCLYLRLCLVDKHCHTSGAKFSSIFIGLSCSRDTIVFIGGNRLSARSARSRKIPGWIINENVSVNRLYNDNNDTSEIAKGSKDLMKAQSLLEIRLSMDYAGAY